MKLDCEDTTRITIRYHQTRFNQHIRVPIIAGYISQKKKTWFYNWSIRSRLERHFSSLRVRVLLDGKREKRKRKEEKEVRGRRRGAEANVHERRRTTESAIATVRV